MKHIDKFLLTIILLGLSLSLCACSKYQSHFLATGFVHSQSSTHAFMNFYRFKGRMVFSFTGDEERPEELICTGHVKEGTIRVCFDRGEGLVEAFSLSSEKEPLRMSFDLPGEKMYIVVEAEDTAQNGELDFTVA